MRGLHNEDEDGKIMCTDETIFRYSRGTRRTVGYNERDIFNFRLIIDRPL